MSSIQPIAQSIETIIALVSSCFNQTGAIQNDITPRVELIALIVLEQLNKAKPLVNYLFDKIVEIIEAGTQSIKIAAVQIHDLISGWLAAIQKECSDAISSTISLCILPSLLNRQNAKFTGLTQSERFDSISFTHDLDVNPDRKTIVYFLGNGSLWQSELEGLSDMHENTGTNVICYNYRGVGRSHGFPINETDLLNDGIQQVRDLLAQGIAADRILLFGHSLGGGVATNIAGMLAEENIVLHLGNYLSFRTLPLVVKKVAPIFAEQCAELVAHRGWALNSEEQLAKLKGKLIVVSNRNDPLITPEIAFKAALLEAPSLQLRDITIIEMDDQEFAIENHHPAGEPVNSHARPFSRREKTALYAAIKNLWYT